MSNEEIILKISVIDDETGTHRITFSDAHGAKCVIHESMVAPQIYLSISDGKGSNASALLTPEILNVLLPYLKNFAATRKLLGG